MIDRAIRVHPSQPGLGLGPVALAVQIVDRAVEKDVHDLVRGRESLWAGEPEQVRVRDVHAGPAEDDQVAERPLLGPLWGIR